MDQDTIENYVKHLGKRDFDALTRLVLQEFFGLRAIDVDGKGDGGSDYLLFLDDNNKSCVAVQRTVQDDRWADKALEDARQATIKRGALRYFFVTSRAHESTALLNLENRITSVLGIPATCLGATELAGIIVQQGLLREFADAIGLSLTIPSTDRPDRAEMLLHAYIALGSDRSELRDEVYDDSLLIVLHESEAAMQRADAVLGAAELLRADEITKERLDRRVDSLLTRGAIEITGSSELLLSKGKALELRIADAIYDRELEGLASAQSQILQDHCGIQWSQSQCAQAATLLSRCFIQRQLRAAEHTSAALTRTGLSRAIGDPDSELRQFLAEAGVARSQITQVLDDFVAVASNLPIIKKLTKAVTYVATEGRDLLKSSRVLGASNWSQVTATLDASVAIPYLCASLFTPSKGRFSRGATECIRLLRDQSARLVMPWVYINEVAAHLIRALDYPELPGFETSLENSNNGFVAHYYQLKAAHEDVPSTIAEFIAQFSGATRKHGVVPQKLNAAVMAQVQPLLASYGVLFDDVSNVSSKYRAQVEREYMHKMHELNRDKSQRLIEHDVLVVSSMRRAIAERSEVRMCLTWDAVMIAVGRELQDCGWIVGPHEASDVIQSRLKITESRLTSLAHSLARVRALPSDKGARIIDRIVQLAGEKLQDWRFRDKLASFHRDALSRIDLNSNSYVDVDREIDGFLDQEGIAKAPSDTEFAE